MESRPGWARIFDAGLSELLELRFCCHEPIRRYYVDVLIAYLRFDVVELIGLEGESDRQTFSETHEARWIAPLVRLRRQIRERRVKLEDADRLAEQVKSLDSNDPWKGEALFVCGLAYEAMESNERAQVLYRDAVEPLSIGGMPRKSVKSIHNHIAALSRVEPERQYIVDYNMVVRKALEVGEPGIAGVAMNNISREQQKMGAMDLAMKSSLKAMELLERYDFGTVHYYRAVVHRAHLLIDLNRSSEADLFIQEAKLCTFPEIHAALSVLKAVKKRESVDPSDELIFTWKERATETHSEAPKISLSPSENELLTLLSQSPMAKFDLIERLYGTRIDPLSAEARFKMLLNRVRKKRPGLLILEDGLYKISDAVFLEEFKKRPA